MDHRSFVVAGHCLDARIQHGIHKFGIRPRADCPAHNKTIEAVDQRRQIHLAGWYLEFGNVGEAERLYKKWFQQPIPPNNVNLGIPMSLLLRDSFRFPTDNAGN